MINWFPWFPCSCWKCTMYTQSPLATEQSAELESIFISRAGKWRKARRNLGRLFPGVFVNFQPPTWRQTPNLLRWWEGFLPLESFLLWGFLLMYFCNAFCYHLLLVHCNSFSFRSLYCFLLLAGVLLPLHHMPLTNRSSCCSLWRFPT